MSAPLPTQLGRYQILDALGKGAMGVVYKAKDPLIGRLVALKTFRVGDASDQELREARERFIREAQSAGILSHPNIVTIHDVVEHSDEGLTFIAMEYVRGTDLKELMRKDEPFDLATIADIIWQVAEALEYAHSKGVVHRDIKPANILLTGDSRVKLTDFGIARLLNTTNLTHSGQLLGTPNYMAPEQIRGMEVDHRADIFSLGVVLYELLTRRKPFAGENLTVVTHRIVNEPFTPPEEFVGELPAGIRAVLERALAKQPEARYQRVGELAVELKRAVQGNAPAPRSLNDTQDFAPPAPPPPTPEAAATTLLRLEDTQAQAASPTPTPAPSAAATVLLPTVAPPPPPSAPPAAGPVVAGPVAATPPAPPVPEPSGSLLSDIDLPPIPERGKGPAAPVAPVPGPAAPGAPPVARSSQKRWLLIAAIPVALLVLVLIGLAVNGLGGSSSPPAPAATPAAPDLLNTAQSLIDRGDFAGALGVLAEAERRLPASPRLSELKRKAEEGSRSRSLEGLNQQQATAYVAAGETALTENRARDAAEAARKALALVPADARAADLLKRAEAAQGRTAPASTPKTPLPTPAAEIVEASPRAATPAETTTAPPRAVPAQPVAPPQGDATLRIQFHSEKPQGVLTVYADKRQLLRESFRFSEKSGFLRSKGVAGELERSITVPAGQTTLRVLVVLDKTEVETIQGNFLPGQARTLGIKVSADGVVSLSLR